MLGCISFKVMKRICDGRHCQWPTCNWLPSLLVSGLRPEAVCPWHSSAFRQSAFYVLLKTYRRHESQAIKFMKCKRTSTHRRVINGSQLYCKVEGSSKRFVKIAMNVSACVSDNCWVVIHIHCCTNTASQCYGSMWLQSVKILDWGGRSLKAPVVS